VDDLMGFSILQVRKWFGRLKFSTSSYVGST